MVIKDIHGDYIKVGKSSITVKDNNGKTKGIVTNCITFSVMTSRDKFLLHKKNISIDETKNCVIQNGDIYYLHNMYLENWIMQQKRPEFFATEIATAEQLKNIAEVMRNKGITVIECIIEK